MQGLRPGTLDLTGRQRSQWGQVLRQLEAEGLLAASLPEGLAHLPPCSPPEAWIELAEAEGQVLPWLLRQLRLRSQDVTLHALGRELGLCVDSRERLQCSPGWRHWTGLDSPAQGLPFWRGAAGGAGPAASSPTVALEAWARRLLCLWRAVPAGAGPSGSSWVPCGLVLDLGGGQLVSLDEAIDPAVPWLLGPLPRHVADEPSRAEARFQALKSEAWRGLRCAEGQTLPRPGGAPQSSEPAMLLQAGPAAPLLDRALLGQAQAGPVLLLGADPGWPPQLCLALLQRQDKMWCHDASPAAMAGGALCLDLQGRLLGYVRPMNTAGGRVLALLWS
ncbi:hypothetical protein H5407_11290 [Mitsuaria sp. WAJ17]|uniref:hypothetical protein n=1 Tax=Mitsuaria sp. WAJ17 TaxID=2761452 RepID=UPI0016043594|nr:hypothetical protein [Mitsuaria sp. WAJ17]MBB2485804.1 hypothetical protein [Mitsuaria sp. WAJ17]